MARIRTVKPEFWTSEQTAECSMVARLLFIGVWNFCDDGGVHPASIKRLKMEIFPSDDITSSNIRGLLDELSSNGLIEFYTVEEKEYFIVTGWDKHQRIDRPTFKYPRPNGEIPATCRRGVDERSPPEGNGKEGNGKEGRRKKQGAKRAIPIPDIFPITDDLRAWGREKVPDVNLDLETEKFIDHYRGNGKLQKDWVSTWRNWMRKSVEFKSGNSKQDDPGYQPACMQPL